MNTASVKSVHNLGTLLHHLIKWSSLKMLLCWLLLLAPPAAQSHAAAPITPSGLNTQVSAPSMLPSGQTQYNITGGTRPAGGTNLFHSFGNFNVPTNNIANFLNDSGLPTSNILGRVTGGNPSSIFGMIQTTGFGNANLFLMNPAGFLFGPNATINVGGMVGFTTADYLRLADGIRFNAMPNVAADALLTPSPVAAFGFLGSNPAAIAIQGSTLQVADGKSLSLVGGNKGFTATDPDTGNPISVPNGVTMTGGTLRAPGGQINIASVAGPGEISAVDFTPTPGMTLGNVSLSDGALIEVSANAAGSVKIRGGQLVINQATISADTADADGAPIAIDIKVTGDVSLSNINAPALAARTSGAGNAGDIAISSGSLNSSFSLTEFGASLIDSHSMGSGHGGNVNITTGTLAMIGDPTHPGYFIDTGTGADGNGGNVSITASDAQFQFGGINTGDNLFFGTGNAGNLTIRANSLILNTASFGTDAFSAQAGAITFDITGLLQISGNSFISNISSLGANPITIKADRFVMNDGPVVLSGTMLGSGGDTSVTARTIEFSNGGAIATQTFGDGKAGNIHVAASERVSLSDDPNTNPLRPSGFYTQSVGDSTLGVHGSAGSITIDTPRLELSGGARLNSSTQTSGRGGDITLHTGTISITGQRTLDIPESQFDVGSAKASGLYTATSGSDLCAGTCGNAGNINISTGSLTLQNGALIDSGTTNSGAGGNITVSATGQILLSGTMLDGTPGGIFSRTTGTDPRAGSGGNILLNADSMVIQNGAQISASSLGTGNAGSVTIGNAASPAQSLLIDGSGSGIFTDTQGAGTGGNISVNAKTVTIQNSGALTANTSGSGNGGDIQIAADRIDLSSFARIATLSSSGPGSAGNIALNASQQITASDAFLNTDAVGEIGNGGNILLSAPTIQANGGVLSTSTAGAGRAGNIALQGQQISLGASPSTEAQGVDLFAITAGSGHGGTITIRGLEGPSSHADNVTIAGHSKVHTLTASEGTAGDITILANRFTLTDTSSLNADTFGSGPAGTINISSTDYVNISGLGSAVTSSSDFGGTGNSGQINITAPNVLIDNDAVVSTSTSGPGKGGTISINANSLQILSGGHVTSGSLIGNSGEVPTGNAGNVVVQGLESPAAQSLLIDGTGSGIFSNTQGTGAGGNIAVQANSIALSNGGTLSAATSGTTTSSTGGTITLNAQQLSMNNGVITASTTGAGAGGTITVNATDTVTMTNGAAIKANSTGQADAGSINLTANNGLSMTNSSITTEVTPTGPGTSAGGGNIKITTSPAATVFMQNSTISASVGDGPGGGGNVSIDPQYVIMENSSILARATDGAGGSILITAGLFLPDAYSVVSADAGSGLNGNVTIQSPISQAGGKIQPLGKAPLLSTSLTNQRCAALAGGSFSSFTVAGRDALPAEPSNWLSSPLALMTEEKGISASRDREMPLVSVRGMAPAGFLTRSFAIESLSGCTS